ECLLGVGAGTAKRVELSSDRADRVGLGATLLVQLGERGLDDLEALGDHLGEAHGGGGAAFDLAAPGAGLGALAGVALEPLEDLGPTLGEHGAPLVDLGGPHLELAAGGGEGRGA